MSSSRIVSIILVVLIHVGLGYALVTGLAYNAVVKVAAELDMIDIQEEEAPEELEEPPPPPPDQPIEPPPVVTPPPIVTPPSAPRPVIQQQQVAPPPAPPVAAPPPPPPPPTPQRARPEPRGRPGNWANANDYPSRALREEREGTTSFRVTVNTKGRVSNCQVTGSSGHSDLDAATCKNIKRRARFRPALDAAGNPMVSSWASRVRWQIPK